MLEIKTFQVCDFPVMGFLISRQYLFIIGAEMIIIFMVGDSFWKYSRIKYLQKISA